MVWIKIKIDGVAKCYLSLAGSGRVFRNYFDLAVGYFLCSFGIKMNFEAEFGTIIQVMDFGKLHGQDQIWLEYDSLYVVKLFEAQSDIVPLFCLACFGNLFAFYFIYPFSGYSYF